MTSLRFKLVRLCYSKQPAAESDQVDKFKAMQNIRTSLHNFNSFLTVKRGNISPWKFYRVSATT